MENIPCKYLEHWSENQSPLGSGRNWPMEFTDCAHPGFPNDSAKEEKLGDGICDETCLGYEPVEIAVCEKHGEFIRDDGCANCMHDSYLECKKSGEEYYNKSNNVRSTPK